MMDFIKNHVNHTVLMFLIVFFTVITLVLVRVGGYGEGFKWASELVGLAMGALLMLMKVKSEDK